MSRALCRVSCVMFDAGELPLCVCLCRSSSPPGPCAADERLQTLLPATGRQQYFCRRQKHSRRHVDTYFFKYDVSISSVSSTSSEIKQSNYLIRSHWHSSHSHGVHGHLSLHLSLHLSWHLAHLSCSGRTDWPRSTHGVVHHHRPKLALVALLRELLLRV